MNTVIIDAVSPFLNCQARWIGVAAELGRLRSISERDEVMRLARAKCFRSGPRFGLCILLTQLPLLTALAFIARFRAQLSNDTLWLVTVILAMPVLLVSLLFTLFRRQLRESVRAELNLRGFPNCLRCGYDRSGIPSHTPCPECGTHSSCHE